MLAATRDMHGKGSDIEKRLKEDGNEENSSGNDAALFGKSVFHENGDVELDGSKKENACENFRG